MKSRFGAVLITFFAVALTLAAVLALVATSIRISVIVSPAWHVAAVAMELVAGVMWLLGTVYVATRAAVFLFGRSAGNNARSEIEGTKTALNGRRSNGSLYRK